MIQNFRTYSLALSLAGMLSTARAQPEPAVPDFAEFNRRAVLPVELGMGFSSRQSKALFSAQVCPQFPLVTHSLRLGATIGGTFTAASPEYATDQWGVYAGPRLAWRIKSLDVKIPGLPEGIPWGNVQVFAEHLWGPGNSRVLGAGIGLEALKRFSVLIKVHRDYEHQSTWGQLALAYNVIGQPKEKSFQDP